MPYTLSQCKAFYANPKKAPADFRKHCSKSLKAKKPRKKTKKK